LTVTVKVAEAPPALHVTVVAPSGKVEPGAGLQDAGRGPLTGSLAVGGVKSTVAPVAPVASTVRFAGTPLKAAVGVTTVTVNDAAVEFPLESPAKQLTVVAPSGNVEPDAGEQVICGAVSTVSVEEVENETAAPFGPVASTVKLPGTVRLGLVVSRTVTLKVPVDHTGLPTLQVTLVVPSENVAPDAGLQTASVGVE
jgi:hypothetical protein